MDIKINDKKFNKDELLNLINKQKLQAIIHVRSMAEIGLKDAKEIVENLESNPNFYDHITITKNNIQFNDNEKTLIETKTENKIDLLNNEPRKTDQFYIDQEKNKGLKFIFLGFLLVILILFLFILK